MDYRSRQAREAQRWRRRPIGASAVGIAVALTASASLAQTAATLPAEETPNRAAETRLLSNSRQLVFEGKRSGEGYFSSDGTFLTFQSEREPKNPFYQIYTLDLTTGDSKRVSTGTGKTTCSWFKPGSHDEVLFASTHLDPDTAKHQQAELDQRAAGKQRRYAWDYDEQMDLFVSRADGGGPVRLTDARGYDAEGSYSPDGTQIAFCSTRSAYEKELSASDKKQLEADASFFGEIYLMNADGSNVRRLTDTPGYDGGPFFSPDGKRIIWRRFDKTGAFADVFTMDLDGSDVRQLTDFGAMSWAPYFHPSGDYVVFASNKLGYSNFEVYLVDAAGTKEPVRVTHSAGFDGLPVFSPDGKQLAWTSSRTADGKSQIFLADWNDQAAREALTQAAPRQSPARRSSTSQPTLGMPSTTAATTARAAAGAITADALRSHVAYLASDELEGRLTGTEGARKASDYLADRLRQAGLQPGATDGSYFQSFDYTAGVEIDAASNSLKIGGTPLVLGMDFSPVSFSENATASGNVVFAGYGLKTAGDGEHGYDSYAGLDVKGKIVCVLRYAPEGVDANRKQELNRYAGLRYKAMLARDRGAIGLLVVTGPNSPNAGELVPLGRDDRDGSCGIPVISLSADAAAKLLGGQDLKAIQDALDREDPHAQTSFASDVAVDLQTALTRRRATDRNVVAMLPPASGDASTAEYVMIGAHYDHLGHGEAGNALSRSDEEGAICNGADDNASGTGVVLEIARTIAQKRQTDPALARRGLIVGFWSGEELGILGSSHFAAEPPVPTDRIAAYVNFDMVGRLRENKLVAQGVGSSTAWSKLIEKRNVAAGFSIVTQTDPYLPTDSTAFYSRGVPTLNLFTGAHADYHRPTDDIDTLNYDGMTRIARFAAAIISDLSSAEQRPDYVKVESTAGAGGREALRTYIGSIPDYAAEDDGVKLGGVRAGSPAEKAGLKTGDLIVEFAGKAIKNIYDYTYAIEAAKVGQPLDVVVLRGGNRVKLTVTPEARKAS